MKGGYLRLTSVWKFRPVHSWAIGELESWMSEMAKEGLHFYKMGLHFGKFKRGEPLDLEYRKRHAMEIPTNTEKHLSVSPARVGLRFEL